jgi:hypothetical protein
MMIWRCNRYSIIELSIEYNIKLSYTTFSETCQFDPNGKLKGELRVPFYSNVGTLVLWPTFQVLEPWKLLSSIKYLFNGLRWNQCCSAQDFVVYVLNVLESKSFCVIAQCKGTEYRDSVSTFGSRLVIVIVVEVEVIASFDQFERKSLRNSTTNSSSTILLEELGVKSADGPMGESISTCVWRVCIFWSRIQYSK